MVCFLGRPPPSSTPPTLPAASRATRCRRARCRMFHPRRVECRPPAVRAPVHRDPGKPVPPRFVVRDPRASPPLARLSAALGKNALHVRDAALLGHPALAVQTILVEGLLRLVYADRAAQRGGEGPSAVASSRLPGEHALTRRAPLTR